MTIPVVDQFGKPLNSVYEESGGNWVPINQTISASGTYTDPVGVGNVGQTVPLGNPLNVAWPASPSPQGPDDASPPVQVAGFALSPGIVDRNVSYANGTLTITWP